ncbi:hypothetical protein Nepgr_027843 [Nepenthes gracilis]|uniref:Uncharacterized protein n=1 Tax=Nepenthes gracilis TaxID=150966 RepID=A0AAD3T985_NEPGR|nr:hypothetical protein Nepgr_027843 [Nepenthes gracilis]
MQALKTRQPGHSLGMGISLLALPKGSCNPKEARFHGKNSPDFPANILAELSSFGLQYGDLKLWIESNISAMDLHGVSYARLKRNPTIICPFYLSLLQNKFGDVCAEKMRCVQPVKK